MAESKEELKSLLIRLKEESEKSSLKLNIQKTKIMTSGPIQFNSVQSLSCVWLFATSWIAALQAYLSITNSRSSLKLTSIESMMPSSHLHPLASPSPPAPKSFPASESFPMSQLFAWGGQSTGVSASASFLPKNITSRQLDGGKIETVRKFIFLDSKISADDDCSLESKRHFLLESKAMTHLDKNYKKQRHHFSDKGP